MLVKGVPGSSSISIFRRHMLTPQTYWLLPLRPWRTIPGNILLTQHHKMTSSNGNIFRVTGHLCREFTGHRWIPRTKASDTELWCFFTCACINGWVNNRETDYLRRHRAHYDVIVIMIVYNIQFIHNSSCRFVEAWMLTVLLGNATFSETTRLFDCLRSLPNIRYDICLFLPDIEAIPCRQHIKTFEHQRKHNLIVSRDTVDASWPRCAGTFKECFSCESNGLDYRIRNRSSRLF